MIKKIAMGAVALAMTTSAALADLSIYTSTFATNIDGSTSVHYWSNWGWEGFNECKTKAKSSARKDVTEFAGYYTDTGSTTSGDGWIQYTISVVHNWSDKGYSTYSCTYFY